MTINTQVERRFAGPVGRMLRDGRIAGNFAGAVDLTFAMTAAPSIVPMALT